MNKNLIIYLFKIFTIVVVKKKHFFYKKTIFFLNTKLLTIKYDFYIILNEALKQTLVIIRLKNYITNTYVLKNILCITNFQTFRITDGLKYSM